MPVRALSIHADYRCRNSGACCRSGWEIPVELAAAERIHEGMSHGRLRPAVAWARPARGLPHGARVLLRVLPSGDCVFLEHGTPRLCALERQLGADAMPPAWRQFPLVVVSDVKQAIRRADLLLVHLADAEALARELSRCEAGVGRVVASSLSPPR